METEEPSSPPGFADMPDLYEIPEELVRNWEAMSADTKFVPALSRIAWDKLYLAIETLNLANAASVNFAMFGAYYKIDKMDVEIEAAKQRTIKIQNALKQFQESVMLAATESSGERSYGK